MSDAAMLGASGYERVEADFYATPIEFVDCLLHVEGRALAKRIVWEPACGEGHISKRLQGYCAGVKSSDLVARGYGTSGLDFLKAPYVPNGVTAIVTNPPYGDLAEAFIRKGLELLAPVSGYMALFLRNEYDCAKERMGLFRDHPYAGKIVCTKRPRWIEGSKGSPRHNYAWYIWDYGRSPFDDPTITVIHPSEARPVQIALAA